ncbi:amidase [Arthrobacter sp. ATA002]|uniref:amidase n=1 Tax=Arthrobacter sp. ATA002 TaxID=2991715 RepID=UPI0022A7F3D8|nr:amidase [Arthrobacter sp. ATA002]WAP51304.1 amidase [Arthrobacter sp. ATA002]
MTETAHEPGSTAGAHAEQVPLHALSAADMSRAFSSGAVTPEDVAEAVVARIRDREPELNALYLFDAADVRAQARASAARWRAGAPLSHYDGVPCTVKENIARAGHPKPSGTALPHPPVSAANAPVTDRLVEAGVVILGSTTMPDWGMLSSGVSSRHGISRGAWNPAWTTGGSSAGAGSAAAAAYGPLHVGTDIGGSIRLPGTWQGLAALKPSAGLVPLDMPYPGRAAGPLARTVGDAAALMSLVARHDMRDYSTRPYPEMDWDAAPAGVEQLKVALHLDAGCGAAVEPEILAAVQGVADVFAAAGAVPEVLGPFMDQELLDGLDNFWRTRSWADFELLAPEDRPLVLEYVARWCSRGASFSGADTIRHYHCMDSVRQRTISATAAFDVVISPVAPMAAFPAEQPMPDPDPDRTMSHIGFTVPYNMSGQPAATVNCGFTADGRPIGVQLSGPVGSDDRLLRAAAWYEANRPASAVPGWAGLR